MLSSKYRRAPRFCPTLHMYHDSFEIKLSFKLSCAFSSYIEGWRAFPEVIVHHLQLFLDQKKIRGKPNALGDKRLELRTLSSTRVGILQILAHLLNQKATVKATKQLRSLTSFVPKSSRPRSSFKYEMWRLMQLGCDRALLLCASQNSM